MIESFGNGEVRRRWQRIGCRPDLPVRTVMPLGEPQSRHQLFVELERPGDVGDTEVDVAKRIQTEMLTVRRTSRSDHNTHSAPVGASLLTLIADSRPKAGAQKVGSLDLAVGDGAIELLLDEKRLAVLDTLEFVREMHAVAHLLAARVEEPERC